MKLIKKAIMIEGMKYDGTNGREIENWSNKIVLESPVLERTKNNPKGCYLQIATIDGNWATAIPGVWVLRGIKGEFYPCQDEIVQSTYDIVPEVGQTIHP